MKNLEIMGVQEMDAIEMKNENGGESLPVTKSDGKGVYMYWYETREKVYEVCWC